MCYMFFGEFFKQLLRCPGHPGPLPVRFGIFLDPKKLYHPNITKLQEDMTNWMSRIV